MSDSPTVFPEAQAELRLAGPAGAIEAAIDRPDPQHARAGTVIVCHPHPLHGGSMHNKVVVMVERSLRELGLNTLRFNFRGVGASEGEYDDGRGETLDLLAVAEWVARTRPGDALWLAGFSFGSYVALLAAQGLPSRVIGERLHLSVRTVENHLQRVYGKLGISKRSELAAALKQLGAEGGPSA